MPDKHGNGCPTSSRLRNAQSGDMRELRRLFFNMVAEAGIPDFNISKVDAAFERGIKRDGSLLLVAPSKPGRLIGFALFGLIPQWFTDAGRLTELCVFIDNGHRRSDAAGELRKVVNWWRRESERQKPENVAAKASPVAAEQKCLPETPQPAAPENSTGVSDTPAEPISQGIDKNLEQARALTLNSPVAQDNNEDTISLLQTLAERNRAMSNGGAAV